MYGKDLAGSRNGGSGGPSPREVKGLRETWRFDTSDGDITGVPVVAGGTLVVGTSGGSIIALDSVSGKVRWTRDIDQPINGSAAIVAAPGTNAAGRVFVPVARPHRPHLLALDLADGSTLWDTVLDTQTDSDVYGSPVVWGRTVFIGVSGYYGEFSLTRGDVNVRGSVVALDTGTGALRWKTYTVPPGRDGGAVWSTPVIDTATGRLFAGTGNAYHDPAAPTTDAILALDAARGTLLDHYQATPGDSWTLAEPTGPDFDFGASPNLFTAPDGRKLVGNGQKSGIYWAFDRETLDPVWQTQVGPGAASGGILGSTAFDGRRIYGPVNSLGAGATVWSLTRGGDLRWREHETGPVNYSPVAVANGVAYITDFTMVVSARDAATGAVLAKLPLDAPTFAGVSVVGGAVYAATGTSMSPSGSVVAFGDTRDSAATGSRGRPRLRLRVRPRRVRVGRRRLYRFRVTTRRSGRLRPVRGATIRFARRRVRTGRRGRARLRVRLGRAGRRRARASKRGYRSARVVIRALRTRRHR
jgi:polyvinyl alcohol dehydrogenase (cytochrome)